MSPGASSQRIIGISSLGDKVAQAFSFEILSARAERIDRVLNFRILPQLGIHAALIGTCMLVGSGKIAVPQIWYWLLAAGFAAAFFAAHAKGWKGSGLLCAAATLGTAAAVTSRGGLHPAILVALTFGAMALVILYWNVSRREMVFAPIYAAVLILLTTSDASAFLLYAPVFLFGMAAVVIGGHIGWSFGLFIGLLLLVTNRFDETSLAIVGLLSAGGILMLLVYVARSVATTNSDFRNFLSQGLGAWMFVILVNAFVTLDPWIIPLLVAIFFLAVALFRRGFTGGPTAFAWLVIAILAAFWGYLGDAGYTREFIWLLVTMAVAKLLDLAARRMRSPLVGKVSLVILLLTALAACLLAIDFTYDELPARMSEMARWSDGAALKLLAASALAVAAIAACYRPIEPRIVIPWWRGLARPRHVLFVRTCYRASERWVSAVPLVGAPLRAVGEAFRALRYLKTNGQPLRLADLALIAAVLLLYVVLRTHARLYLEAGAASGEIGLQLGWASAILAAAACGISFYLLGLMVRQYLFFFVGALLMIVQFIVTLYAQYDMLDVGQVGLMSLIVGVVLVTCAGIRALYFSARPLNTR